MLALTTFMLFLAVQGAGGGQEEEAQRWRRRRAGRAETKVRRGVREAEAQKKVISLVLLLLLGFLVVVITVFGVFNKILNIFNQNHTKLKCRNISGWRIEFLVFPSFHNTTVCFVICNKSLEIRNLDLEMKYPEGKNQHFKISSTTSFSLIVHQKASKWMASTHFWSSLVTKTFVQDSSKHWHMYNFSSKFIFL